MYQHLLHFEFIFAEQTLQALARIEKHASILVCKQQQGGAVVVYVGSQNLSKSNGQQTQQKHKGQQHN